MVLFNLVGGIFWLSLVVVGAIVYARLIDQYRKGEESIVRRQKRPNTEPSNDESGDDESDWVTKGPGDRCKFCGGPIEAPHRKYMCVDCDPEGPGEFD